MNMTTTIAFSKMNGLGNDFVIIDARDRDLALSPDNVRDLAARDNDTTKGCDQLLVIHPPKNGGDIFMQIFNADGSEVEACGNGTRAVAAYMAQRGHSACLIDTLGGALACNSQSNGHDATATHNVQVAMPLPKIGAAMSLHQDLPDALPVDVGNPHGVIFVATGTAGLAAQYGFQLERHTAFPQRANINFASLQGDNLIRLDTWERGVGLTKACGTGACATAVAAIAQGLCAPGAVTVRPPYNQDDNATDVLIIDYQPDTHLLMTGPVAHDFDAAVTL
jgi:diaminopimelate epimerase